MIVCSVNEMPIRPYSNTLINPFAVINEVTPSPLKYETPILAGNIKCIDVAIEVKYGYSLGIVIV